MEDERSSIPGTADDTAHSDRLNAMIAQRQRLNLPKILKAEILSDSQAANDLKSRKRKAPAKN